MALLEEDKITSLISAYQVTAIEGTNICNWKASTGESCSEHFLEVYQEHGQGIRGCTAALIELTRRCPLSPAVSMAVIF